MKLLDTMRNWFLPKVHAGMSDRELYEKMAAIAGDEYFTIERKVTRYGSTEKPEAVVTVYVAGKLDHQAAASNGEVWALVQMELAKENIRSSQPPELADHDTTQEGL